MLEVTDDSRFLAVIVPANYSTFVAADWTLDQLLEHFNQQMAAKSLLIWGTGLEGFWKVDVRLGESNIRGFREVSGPLHVSGGTVLVTNYESLTMAAQFADVRLPEAHQKGQIIELGDGDYCCRIIQMFDPEEQETAEDDGADFVVEFSHKKVLPECWPNVPWFER